MRTLCDVCESAAAILFCAADEASLCRACDDKVHMCNKLASRHVRVGLAKPSEVPRCDICENAPGMLLHIPSFPNSYLKKETTSWAHLYVAFFYCEVDGTSLCLQCDMIVHVGGKRTHGRYLLLRQRVEFPVDKQGSGNSDEPGSHRLNLGEAKREPSHSSGNENPLNHRVSADLTPDNNTENDGNMENMFIDLNSRPQRMHATYQGLEEGLADNNHQSERVVPDGYFKREPEK